MRPRSSRLNDPLSKAFTMGYLSALVVYVIIDVGRAFHISYWALLPLIFVVYFTARRWGVGSTGL